MPIPCHQSTPAYQLRIQLRGISPPIWRRLLIPVSSTFLNLHEAIQAAMGWEDCHLNRFTIRGQFYGFPLEGGMCFSTHPDRYRLIDFDFCEHERFVYEYDFFSCWVHDVRIEKLRASVSGLRPMCIAGVGACPPEDSGPADCYMQQFDEHTAEDTLEWLRESLNSNLPMADIREEFIDRTRWADNRFDRCEANARLQSQV